MGRPTEWTEKRLEEEAKALLEWFEDDDNYWLKKFAIERGYSGQNLTELAKKSEIFSEALKRAKEIQELKLVHGGLMGKFNAAVTIFALKNVAKWRNKFEHENKNETLDKLTDWIENFRIKKAGDEAES